MLKINHRFHSSRIRVISWMARLITLIRLQETFMFVTVVSRVQKHLLVLLTRLLLLVVTPDSRWTLSHRKRTRKLQLSQLAFIIFDISVTHETSPTFLDCQWVCALVAMRCLIQVFDYDFRLLDLLVEVVECFFETFPICFLLQISFESIDLSAIIFTHCEDISLECLHFGDEFCHFLFLRKGVLFYFLIVFHFIFVFPVGVFLGGGAYRGESSGYILFGVVVSLDVWVELFDILLHIDYLMLSFQVLLG